MENIQLTIDGYRIEAEKGTSILNAALNSGIYIPHLCYHPNLEPFGNCNLCVAEIEGVEGIIKSCETIAKQDMVVSTKSKNVEKVRGLALELMMASHPKDCTSCDKYLNCELQALMQYVGVVHSRMREIEKEHVFEVKSDCFIKREMQRCIHCERCVRVCENVRGVGVLKVNKKNSESYIGTVDDKKLTDIDCRYCGACVEVCPTGAIQDVKGIFKTEAPRGLAYIPCKNECPAHADIPTYLRLVGQEKYSDAVSVIREKLTFPHSLGYICTHACESGCKRTHLNEAISIREAKKFAVENDKTENWKQNVTVYDKNEKRVAVIGGGPAGMTAAFYLSKKGYYVDVYEKQNRAGGMLSFGIPRYRLPQSIVENEINILLEFGINVIYDTKIESIADLKEKNYDATLIAIGATEGKRPPSFAKRWKNSMDAVNFCEASNKDALKDLPDNIVIYGGGNVAFDCAITAKKKGVKNVSVICMETREKMLADEEEIALGLSEGIEILNRKIISNIDEKDDIIKSVTTKDISRFEFTKDGLVTDEIEGSESELVVDWMIFATGQKPDMNEEFGIDVVRGCYTKVDETLKTSVDNIFAAGDVVYGTKSVVQAIESGRNAAKSIDKYLGGNGQIEDVLLKRDKVDGCIGKLENFAELKRKGVLESSCDATYETSRCLQCDLRLDIEKVKFWVDEHYKNVREVNDCE